MRKFDSRVSRSGTGSLQVPKVTKMLLLIIVGGFLFGLLFRSDSLIRLGLFTPELAVESGQVWRFLTSSFVHLNGYKLLSYICLLFFFTKNVELMIGAKRYLILFLLGGLSGPVLYSLLVFSKLIPHTEGVVLAGATSGCFALLVALYMMAGEMMVQLFFFPKPFKQRWVLIGLAVVWIVSLLLRRDGINTAAEASSIAGGFVGWLLMRYAYDSSWFGGKRGGKVKKRNASYEAKLKPKKPAILKDSEVDKILDKISEQGFQSLTDKERKILEKASKKDE